jgi:hypothetical protein
MAFKNIGKLPKRKVTPEELLGVDDITNCLQELYEKRFNIDQFVLIYTDKEAVPYCYWQGTKERIVYSLEHAKYILLSGGAD